MFRYTHLGLNENREYNGGGGGVISYWWDQKKMQYPPMYIKKLI